LKFPFLRDSEIAAAASQLCERAYKGAIIVAPVSLDCIVFDCLCEHDGLIFTDEERLGQDEGAQILGRTELLAGRISVDCDLKQAEPRRYRFTVAHELGHWVLHRPLAMSSRDHPELFPKGTVLVTTESSLSPSQPAGRRVPPVEWQANRFASFLLIPRALLRNEFHARYGETPPCLEAGVPMREFCRSLARRPFARTQSLVDAFDVSIEAMAIAIDDADLVSNQPLLL
jgi:hypothetical protein